MRTAHYFDGPPGALGALAGGLDGAGAAGAAGADWAGFVSSGTTVLVRTCVARIVSPSDVTMNSTARAVVSFDRNVAAPRPPKTVWLEPPPKTAPMSAPLPVCS